MKARVNYSWVGFFVILLTLILLSVFVWLSSSSDETQYTPYLIYVHDDVTGLANQSDVRYNGVRIGYVKAIDLDPNNPQLVRIMVLIEQGTPIMTSTVATLSSQGITGLVYVSLKATSMHAPLLQKTAGDDYPVIKSEPSLLMQLSTIVPQLSDNLKTITDGFKNLFNEQNQKAYSDSLDNINVFTRQLADSTHKIESIVTSLDETMKNTSQITKNFPQLMSQMKLSMKQLDQTLVTISKASTVASKTMSNGDVAVNTFSTQVLPGAQQLMVKLNNLSENLNDMTEDLQRNPSMLIRGKYPEQPGPGENK